MNTDYDRKHVTVFIIFFNFIIFVSWRGTSGGAVGLGTALQAGMSRDRFPMLSLEFFI